MVLLPPISADQEAETGQETVKATNWPAPSAHFLQLGHLQWLHNTPSSAPQLDPTVTHGAQGRQFTPKEMTTGNKAQGSCGNQLAHRAHLYERL